MRDLIIGCVHGYQPTDVAPWLTSIRRSGFGGLVAVILYGDGSAENETAAYLERQGVDVVRAGRQRKSIVIDRFFDMARYVSATRATIRFVIATDVGDLVFQRDPSAFLAGRMETKEILVGSECVLFEHETWGRANMQRSFPNAATSMLRKEIYNAGSVAARAEAAVELFGDVFWMCRDSPVHNSDQAALNILLHGKYVERTCFCPMREGWSVQLGTVGDPRRRAEYGHQLTESVFAFKEGVGYTESGDPFCIVHQYNRVPALHDSVRARYAGETP